MALGLSSGPGAILPLYLLPFLELMRVSRFWRAMDAYGDWLDEPASFRVSVIRLFGSLLAYWVVMTAVICGGLAAFGVI